VATAEELCRLADERHLVLQVDHTFIHAGAVRKIRSLIDEGQLGDILYVDSVRVNLGLFQKDINVTWDLAPHDISIILYIMEEFPIAANCRGSAHVTPKVEDVTTLCLSFRNNRTAIVQSSWLDPRKVREMTIVGSKRMIVYDDVAQIEKIKVFDARVETPPHYDTFADFHYSYHYGDMYVPYIKQEEPLKVECQHFLDCIENRVAPLSDGKQGLELVRILEAASLSLKQDGGAVHLKAADSAIRKHNGEVAAERGKSKNGFATAELKAPSRLGKENGVV
jgi:predicted dehydrogenase